MRPRVLVSGTGRAATTFLMRLLTELGGDTGYRPDGRGWYEDVLSGAPASGGPSGGMERHPRASWGAARWEAELPGVSKDPQLCTHLGDLLDAGFSCSALIIPVRDLSAAARSRSRAGLSWDSPGDPPPGEAELRPLLAAALGELVAAAVSRCVLTLTIPFHALRDPEQCADYLTQWAVPDKVALSLFPRAREWGARREVLEAHARLWRGPAS